MSQDQQPEPGALHQIPSPGNNAMVVRIPKPNIQVMVLGLIAFITLFQTFQLVRIGGKANAATVKSAPASAASHSGAATQQGTGSGADVPQSMVGGC